MLQKIYISILPMLFILSDAKPPILTAKEKTAVDKLRLAVGNKLTANYMKSDAYLVKWVKAKKFDEVETKQALEKTLEWRRQVNADDFPFEQVPEDITKRYVFDFSYKDRNGAQIVLFAYGDWDVRKKALEGKISELSHRMDWMEEVLAQLSFNSTGDPTSVILADYNRYSLRKHACAGCIPLYVTWAIHHELHYPYSCYKIIAINTPRIFDPVVRLVWPLMSAATQAAVKIHGYDRAEWIKEIEETIDSAKLPVRFGGNAKKKE